MSNSRNAHHSLAGTLAYTRSRRHGQTVHTQAPLVVDSHCARRRDAIGDSADSSKIAIVLPCEMRAEEIQLDAIDCFATRGNPGSGTRKARQVMLSTVQDRVLSWLAFRPSTTWLVLLRFTQELPHGRSTMRLGQRSPLRQ